jgi:hypothetical protein
VEGLRAWAGAWPDVLQMEVSCCVWLFFLSCFGIGAW